MLGSHLTRFLLEQMPVGIRRRLFTASENYVIPSQGAFYSPYIILFTSAISAQIIDGHGPIMRILHHLVPPCHEDHHGLRSRH